MVRATDAWDEKRISDVFISVLLHSDSQVSSPGQDEVFYAQIFGSRIDPSLG